MTSSTMLAAAAVALAASSTMAMARSDISLSQDNRFVFAAPRGSAHFTPHFVKKPVGTTIFSNLALAYPKGLYFSGEGDSLFGGSKKSQYDVAVGFTPTTKASAVEVDAAIGIFDEGNNSFTVSIAEDSGGIPGTVLASTVAIATAPFGECCGLTVAKFKGGGVPLAAGQPYWVTVTFDKKQALSEGAWSFATIDQVDPVPFAFNPSGEGWMLSPTTLPPAVAIYSK